VRFASLLLLFFSLTNVANAADHSGKWFFLWGYNRADYKNSEINLSGPGYNYTLHDVKANDRPSEFQWSYLVPDLTIPQTNTRIGKYLDETSRVTFGVDHMKYIMTIGQVVNRTGTDHQGNPSNANQQLDLNYLQYEHTDGLNYIHLGYEMLHPFWQNEYFHLSALHGPDIGLVLPKTNVTLGGYKQNHDDFNIAGYGAAYKVGLVADVGKNWFMQLEFKKGQLNMPWIRTSNSTADGASQKIEFLESVWALGYVFD
jgi:hypothetical protein